MRINQKLQGDAQLLLQMTAAADKTEAALGSIRSALDACFHSVHDSNGLAEDTTGGIRKLRENLQRLKSVVRDTLDVSAHVKSIRSSTSGSASDLVALLMLDGDAGTQSPSHVSDSRLEQDCAQELQRCTQWAPIADMQALLGHLVRVK